MTEVTSALFERFEDANAALRQLGDMGYTEADVSVITKEDQVKIEHEASEGVANAATTGGVIGGVLGLVAGIAAFAVPGVGALFISGPIAAALGLTGAAATTASGAITGAVVGGLVGLLKELGIDEVQAKVIEDRVKNGDTLLLIYPGDDEKDEVKEVLENNNGKHIYELDLITA